RGRILALDAAPRPKTKEPSDEQHPHRIAASPPLDTSAMGARDPAGRHRRRDRTHGLRRRRPELGPATDPDLSRLDDVERLPLPGQPALLTPRPMPLWKEERCTSFTPTTHRPSRTTAAGSCSITGSHAGRGRRPSRPTPIAPPGPSGR